MFAPVPFVFCAFIVACYPVNLDNVTQPPNSRNQITPIPENIGSGVTEASTPDRWSELLMMTPYPYSAELRLPLPFETIVDGMYFRVDPRDVNRAKCRRCPPYPPIGGMWVLKLENGVFKVYHENTSWRSLGSYVIDDDQFFLFNDPNCVWSTGAYTWKMTDGHLQFQAVADDCGAGSRAKMLTSELWKGCRTSTTEAPISGHSSIPLACE